jgi:hypothetical protein
MVTVMNPGPLSRHALALSAPAREALGLIVTELLEPLLLLDRAADGPERRDACTDLWRIAVQNVGNLTGSYEVRQLVATTHELRHQHQEPDGPEVYRLDYLAALLYAVRSFTENSQHEITWCLQRVSDSLGFLAEEVGSEELPAIDDQVVSLISDLKVRSAIDETSVMSLRWRLDDERDTINRMVNEAITVM